jgi:hypothetical protein
MFIHLIEAFFSFMPGVWDPRGLAITNLAFSFDRFRLPCHSQVPSLNLQLL